MNEERRCAIGVDLGGTKTALALVDETGEIAASKRIPTDVEGGPEAVMDQITEAVEELRRIGEGSPEGVGVGFAGQIESSTGAVIFSPNLGWRDVPLRADLTRRIGLPVSVTNDVRAATLGEWLFGAGRGCDELMCVFVGTGVGGGIVVGGRLLAGCSNMAGEVGHITVDLKGPLCTCGKRGCLEAIAGGWAIAQRAQDAVLLKSGEGAAMLRMVGGKRTEITAEIVAKAFHAGDPLAAKIIDEAAEALIAGAVSLINAFNPCRLILGGGVIEGLPFLVERIAEGVRFQALSGGCAEVVRSELGNGAGVMGAAALAMKSCNP